MNILHMLNPVLFVITLPTMYTLFMVTLRFWPPVLFGIVSVLLVAADEGQLVRATCTITVTGVVIAAALEWRRRTIQSR